MTEANPSLFNVWREVSRHSELGVCLRSIAGGLQAELPLRCLLIRRVDRTRLALETVGAYVAGPDARPPEAKSELTAPQCDSLDAWFAQGTRVVHAASIEATALSRLAVPAGVEGDLVVGLLGRDEGLTGVAVFAAEPNATFDDHRIAIIRRLLEPLAIALENDLRFRETAALREAAEAEKRSLLNRLGRKALADTVVGAGSGLRSVMERVALVAPSDVPVLIVGETGTGKELAARLIHNQSSRSAGPFIRVNCGAIPSELIDSQLFGHERGAFTGAVETRHGWFERADGGTLLLDELGELPLAAQVRLLRILQDGWLERVGGHSPINVDVRIVAATNRDLAAMVAAGTFREDLWYRIAVFPIRLPPLRERREDIAELAAHFAGRAAVRFVLPTVLPTPDDIELLKAYAWPGNIRELGAVIDRAAILGNGRRLEVAKALGVGTLAPPAPVETPPPPEVVPAVATDEPIVSLDAAMKRHIEAALRVVRGRIEGPHGAAELLKINPHTLRARMRKLQIDWKFFREESS